jgi:hypothetical protein|tara:strand:- start:5205 stop:5441 length:237 start_codon:yes stop_codon:yes gene_type:complete
MASLGNNYVDEYLHQASNGIEDAVGLTLVCDTDHMLLRAPNDQIVACVPCSDDLPGDIDRLRGAWFHTTSNMSNSTWD